MPRGLQTVAHRHTYECDAVMHGRAQQLDSRVTSTGMGGIVEPLHQGSVQLLATTRSGVCFCRLARNCVSNESSDGVDTTI